MTDSKTSGWHVMRFTLTALSPLSSGAGEGAMADNAIARDAMGLPMIPGATLQGLLRRDFLGEDCDKLFGALTDQGVSAGRILCSNGIVHGADNIAVTPDGAADDHVLTRLASAAPLKRDHVRLDHRHGAAETGKFDRAAVPKGTRFSFEWLMFGAEEESELLLQALAPLQADWFRIGSSGARGYGRVKRERLHHAFFTEADSHKLRNLRTTPLSAVGGLTAIDRAARPQALTIELALDPVNPWRVGQDGVSFQKTDDGKQAVNLTPMREPEISWTNDNAIWKTPEPEDTDHYVLPGSALRGPLAHRALFHWNRHNQRLIDGTTDASAMDEFSARPAPLQALFGFARDGEGGEEGGQASPLLFEDVALKVTRVDPFHHVKIDRFTGGATPKALFQEELAYTERLTARIVLRPNFAMDQTAREALVLALRDLCDGRLALGAKSLGYFGNGTVRVDGPGAEDWPEDWQVGEASAS